MAGVGTAGVAGCRGVEASHYVFASTVRQVVSSRWKENRKVCQRSSGSSQPGEKAIQTVSKPWHDLSATVPFAVKGWVRLEVYMLKDDVAARLVALKEKGAPKSVTALVRELFDQFDEALKHSSFSQVVAELNQAGISVELSGFRTAYYRVKRKRPASKQVEQPSQLGLRDILICPHCSLTLTKNGQPWGTVIADLSANSRSVSGAEVASASQPKPIGRMSDLYRR